MTYEQLKKLRDLAERWHKLSDLCWEARGQVSPVNTGEVMQAFISCADDLNRVIREIELEAGR